MTEVSERTGRKNHELAKRMRLWALVALVLGILGSTGLPDLMVVFGDRMQEMWQLLRFVGWVAVFFGLPLSAALFVGAILVRRLPE